MHDYGHGRGRRIGALAAMLLTMALAGCTDTNGAKQALAQAGYTNVEITGYTFWGCSDRDTFHTGFKATGPNGHPVKGVVCSGIFKGKTIRLD